MSQSEEKLHINPSLIVLAGLPLGGKTAIGNQLAHSTDAVFFDIDQSRQEISPGKAWLGPEKEKEIMLAAYKRNHERAGEALRLGRAVVLSATYSRDIYHKMAQELADLLNVPLHFFLVKITEDKVLNRIEQRIKEESNSNITDINSYREVQDRYNEPPNSVILDGTLPPEENVKSIITRLLV